MGASLWRHPQAERVFSPSAAIPTLGETVTANMDLVAQIQRRLPQPGIRYRNVGRIAVRRNAERWLQQRLREPADSPPALSASSAPAPPRRVSRSLISARSRLATAASPSSTAGEWKPRPVSVPGAIRHGNPKPTPIAPITHIPRRERQVQRQRKNPKARQRRGLSQV